MAKNEDFMIARVSEDGRIVGIEHATDADWFAVRHAHEVLRDRLNERLWAMAKCPYKPKGGDDGDA